MFTLPFEQVTRTLLSKEFILGMITALTASMIINRLTRSAPVVAKAPPPRPKSTSRKYVDEEAKMVILVRSDLNMGKGKAAAQACHAVLAAYKEASRKDPAILDAWESTGQAKVTLKVESEEEMIGLVKKAREYGVIAQYIRDAGRTQLAPNTTTCAAIGPAPKNLVDLITGHLKLY